MIVLEQWKPKKPISAIYWDGAKERYYVKRFLIEHPDKEELFISEDPKSYLEIVSTDYLPIAELVYNKIRGKDQKPNDEVNLAEFISVKGIGAQGNRLTTEKVKQINLLDPLPYEEPEPEQPEAIEVVDEATVTTNTDNEGTTTNGDTAPSKPINLDDLPPEPDADDEGQTLLF